jgi:hypothetical protein
LELTFKRQREGIKQSLGVFYQMILVLPIYKSLYLILRWRQSLKKKLFYLVYSSQPSLQMLYRNRKRLKEQKRLKMILWRRANTSGGEGETYY